MIHTVEAGETVYDQDGCKGIRICEAGGNEYVQLPIAPGGGIPENRLPLAVSFYILKGSGICMVSGTPYSTSEGDMLECPPGEPRGWTNESGQPLEVLVITRVKGL